MFWCCCALCRSMCTTPSTQTRSHTWIWKWLFSLRCTNAIRCASLCVCEYLIVKSMKKEVFPTKHLQFMFWLSTAWPIVFSSALNFREPRFFCFLMKQRHFTGSQLSAEFFSGQDKAVPETLRWLFQFLGILFANLLAGLGTVFFYNPKVFCIAFWTAVFLKRQPFFCFRTCSYACYTCQILSQVCLPCFWKS